jgi:hypothetical protein
MSEREWQVHLHHVTYVWSNRQMQGQRQVSHLPPFGDAPEANGIGLHKMDRPCERKVSEIIQRVELFAERDWRFDGPGQSCMSLDVVLPNGFFKPVNIVVFALAAKLDRRR